MKNILTLLTTAGLLAAATAQAQVEFYITGSTAFRANAYRSIRALYGANLVSQNPADSSGTPNVNQVTFSGTLPALFGGQTVTIRTAYNGSAAGVQAVAQNLNLTFLANATPAGDTNTMSHQADLAFSDVFQAATAFISPSLDNTNVGVQPFVYVKSLGTAANVTNITFQQLQALLPNGVLPLSYFTGNSADDTKYIFLVGRDSGSGTRITAEKDALFLGSELEYAPDTNCVWNIFSGFSSGSGITGVLNGSCGSTTNAVGYLGLSDAKNVNSGGNIVTYDGTLPYRGLVAAPDFTPTRKGIYSLWGYEHLYQRTTASANLKSFRTAFSGEIENDLATSTTAIQVSSMGVKRSFDGGPITP
jgi:hypothetical protein